MRITIKCGSDSQPRAGFWKNNGAAARAAVEGKVRIRIAN